MHQIPSSSKGALAALRRVLNSPGLAQARASWRGYAMIGIVLASLGLGYATLAGAFSRRLTPAVLVDRQQGATPHAGFRRAHAKGICVEGVFLSSGRLAPYVTTPMFGEGETPFVGRFSIGGNNPTAPDLKAGVRSLALDFRLANGERWRTAMNINPVLAVRDVEAFYAQLGALAPDPATGRPSAARLAAFFDAHPESQPFLAWQRAYVPTASFATESYHGINAFLLTDASGRQRAVRWSALPLAAPGENRYDDADALQAELRDRLAKGPVRFALEFTLADAGDVVHDPSTPWPATRERVRAGVIEVRAATPQADGPCNGINFDPLVLPSGMAPSADPILHARSAAYAESQRRRATEVAREALR
ncbi:MAG: catalase family peroxidase [Gemmatimonadaceae bacterium]|nr:catalase family peroxidase [Gemmatimonadaceae bacterium]